MWEKYCPLIVKIESSLTDYNEGYKALTILDKKLKPNGARAKTAGAFSIYPVR